MKLDPKGVEKAEAAMALANPYSDTDAKDRVTAALTAYFDHLIEVGKMKEANLRHRGAYYPRYSYEKPDAFIIRTDKE